jgi:hypothetical protein
MSAEAVTFENVLALALGFLGGWKLFEIVTSNTSSATIPLVILETLQRKMASTGGTSSWGLLSYETAEMATIIAAPFILRIIEGPMPLIVWILALVFFPMTWAYAAFVLLVHVIEFLKPILGAKI